MSMMDYWNTFSNWFQSPAGQGQKPGATNAHTFASMMGQLGAAISPQGSWQQNVGNVAANWGTSGLYYDAVRRGLEQYNKQQQGGQPNPNALPGKEGGEMLPVPKDSPYRLEGTAPMFNLQTPELTFDRKMLQEILAGYGM